MQHVASRGSAFGELFVVVDARLGSPIGLREELDRHGLPFELVRTEGDGETQRLVSRALRAGKRFVVAVGGDRVVNGVVNGMFDGDATIVERPVLGIVAAGARNDFAMTFGLPRDAARACAHLTRATTYAADVLRATAAGPDGGTVSRWFVNLARVGLWPAADSRGARSRLGRVGRFLSFWRTVAGFRPVPTRVAADRKILEARVHDIVVGNCQFFDGMKLSPRSYPGDGVMDVQVFRGPLSEAYSLLWQVARGEHLPRPTVVEVRAKGRVSVEAEEPLIVEVDGELLGTTPARFEAFPQAIQIKL